MMPAARSAEDQLRCRAPSDGSTFVGVSRSLLEATVRARVLRRGNVTVLAARAAGLASADGARVTGLIVRDVGAAPDADPRTVEADLVVDATGRRSSAPRWLVELGYPEIPETSITTGVGYATRWYRRPATRQAGWTASIVNALRQSGNSS